MLLFAFILESGAHRIVLSLPAGSVIKGSIWLYALYGGFMAGLFEETGRYLAFSFALKKYRAKNVNALMYGAGHGGFEAVVVVGLTMINKKIDLWGVTSTSGIVCLRLWNDLGRSTSGVSCLCLVIYSIRFILYVL